MTGTPLARRGSFTSEAEAVLQERVSLYLSELESVVRLDALMLADQRRSTPGDNLVLVTEYDVIRAFEARFRSEGQKNWFNVYSKLVLNFLGTILFTLFIEEIFKEPIDGMLSIYAVAGIAGAAMVIIGWMLEVGEDDGGAPRY